MFLCNTSESVEFILCELSWLRHTYFVFTFEPYVNNCFGSLHLIKNQCIWPWQSVKLPQEFSAWWSSSHAKTGIKNSKLQSSPILYTTVPPWGFCFLPCANSNFKVHFWSDFKTCNHTDDMLVVENCLQENTWEIYFESSTWPAFLH